MRVFEPAVARDGMQQLATDKEFLLRPIDPIGGQVIDRAFSRRPFEQTGILANTEIRLLRQLLHGQFVGIMIVQICNRTLDCSGRVLLRIDRSRLLQKEAKQLLKGDLHFELLDIILRRPTPQQSLTVDEHAMSRLHVENVIETEPERFPALIPFTALHCPK